MDILATIAALLVGLVALDLAALRWGVDSRESTREEHRGWPIH
jgi:hypothetical protein